MFNISCENIKNTPRGCMAAVITSYAAERFGYVEKGKPQAS